MPLQPLPVLVEGLILRVGLHIRPGDKITPSCCSSTWLYLVVQALPDLVSCALEQAAAASDGRKRASPARQSPDARLSCCCASPALEACGLGEAQAAVGTAALQVRSGAGGVAGQVGGSALGGAWAVAQ